MRIVLALIVAALAFSIDVTAGGKSYRPKQRSWTLDDGKKIVARFSDIQDHYIIVKDEYYNYRKIDFFKMSKPDRMAAAEDARSQADYLNPTKSQKLFERFKALVEGYAVYSGQEERMADMKAEQRATRAREEAAAPRRPTYAEDYQREAQARKVSDLESKVSNLELDKQLGK